MRPSEADLSLRDRNIIARTRAWIEDVVIGLNLCPFAARPFQNDRIHYQVLAGKAIEEHLQQLGELLHTLENDTQTETALLIFAEAWRDFDDYLNMLDTANRLIDELGFRGQYQLASFHPQYVFEGSEEDDAANFSNRSPWPMLHVLRESSLSQAIDSHPDIAAIPDKNIETLRKLERSQGIDCLQRHLTDKEKSL